jgi:hypothetical protein
MSTGTDATSVAAPIDQVRRPRVTRALLVAVLGAHAVAAAAQPFLAGAYLSGQFDAIGLHGTNGSLMSAWCLLQFVVAVLFWRPGRGPGWPALATVAVFLAEGAQTGTGYAGQLGIHVPLGVAIVGGTVAMFIWSLAWRPKPWRG